MTYTCYIQGDTTFAYNEGEMVAKFDTDTFLMSVISPREFRAFERNPEKTKFYIRKLEFNIYKLRDWLPA